MGNYTDGSAVGGQYRQGCRRRPDAAGLVRHSIAAPGGLRSRTRKAAGAAMASINYTTERALAALERGLEAAGRALIVLGTGDEVLLATAQAERWLQSY